jgi:hypothetical protein
MDVMMVVRPSGVCRGRLAGHPRVFRVVGRWVGRRPLLLLLPWPGCGRGEWVGARPGHAGFLPLVPPLPGVQRAIPLVVAAASVPPGAAGASAAALGAGLPADVSRCRLSVGDVVPTGPSTRLPVGASAGLGCDCCPFPMGSKPGKLGVTGVPPLRARITVRWSTRSPGVGSGWLFAIWSGTTPRTVTTSQD